MTIQKISFCLKTFFICLIFLSGCSVQEESRQLTEERLPNIIILLADDLGYGDLSSYGHPYIRTPNIDQLAEEGIKLLNCYAASPVCSPSRVGLLTGRIPNRMGVYDWIPENSAMHMPASEITIASFLKEKGYQTGQFGKWHCNGKFNSEEQPQPGDHGFDYWFATQNNAIPSHENPINFVENGNAVGQLEGYSSDIVASRLIDWLQKRDPETPFFCYVPFHEPHEPVESPRSLVDAYEKVALNTDQAHYFASVSNMDSAIGRIMQAMKEMNVDDNTLIIFTSDNGPEMVNRYPGASRSYGSPGGLRGMKVHLYEGGVRVPGIIRWPAKVKGGQVSDQPVISFDFLPTIVSMLGGSLSADRAYDGEDLASLLSGEPFERHKELFWFYPTAVSGPNVAMVDGHYKIAAYTKNRYLKEGDTKGILIGDSTIEAIKADSLAGFEFYDLQIYPSEYQYLSRAENAVFDSLKPVFVRKFYEVREDSPVYRMGF